MSNNRTGELLRDILKTPEDRAREKISTSGRALAVFYEGCGVVVAWQAGEAMQEFVSDLGYATKEGFVLKDIEHEKLADGVWIGELAIVSLGPSDWADGSLEYGLAFRNARKATQAEWTEHLDGCWPWDEQEGWS